MEAPDAISLRQFFDGARFQSGSLRGRWVLNEFEFPNAVVSIRCHDGRHVALRFECAGYPHALPTAQVWDARNRRPLPPVHWPRGESRINAVFRPDWKAGSALYVPCDRNAIDGHTDWANNHPEMIWDPGKGLLVYLEAVHSLLQSHDLTMVDRNG